MTLRSRAETRMIYNPTLRGYRTMPTEEILTIAASGVSLIISVTALSVSLWDRRPRLMLRARKGDWYHLKPSLRRTEVIFMGMIEIFNAKFKGKCNPGLPFLGPKERWAMGADGERALHKHDAGHQGSRNMQ